MPFHQGHGVPEHVPDEGDDVDASQGCGVALVVLDQPAAACAPGERLVDNPASVQQDEVALHAWQLDDMQRDAPGRSLCSCLSGAPLINVGKPDAVAGYVLDIGGKALDCDPVADISRNDVEDEPASVRRA